MNKKILDELFVNLKDQEGYYPNKYFDCEGVETIAIGKTKASMRDSQLRWLGVDSWEDIVEVSEEQAERLLKEDIEYFYTLCENEFEWFRWQPITVKYVVINMCFNIGIGGYSGFPKTINYIKKRLYHEASIEMLDSDWAEQVKGRALRLSKIMMCGHFNVPSIELCREEYKVLRKRVK